jgi:hypothetical protein
MTSTTTVSPQPSTHPPARRRRRGLRVLGYLLGGSTVAAAAAWVGLRTEPAASPAPDIDAADVQAVPLPDGLPDPVARFYTTLYGDRVPVIDSAVISGRGRMRIAGITFPARYRFSHITGDAYRHYIELTMFGRRVLSVDEWFVDGQARLELPFGVSEGPNVDQGANLALWAEAVWMPSVWITDPRARWDAVDEHSALLHVPFGDEDETFAVQFDPDTGLLHRMESLRYKGEKDGDKTLWINDAIDWGEVNGHPVPLRAEVTWADEGSPWARLRTEDVRYNGDLSAYITAGGP